MERDHRPSDDAEHARRWRRNPFAPATFRRPPSGGTGGAGGQGPRDQEPHGGEATDAERPPTG